MSGAEVSYHSTIGKPALAFNNTVKLGRYLGCSQVIAQQIWDCILTRSTNDIIEAVETIPVGCLTDFSCYRIFDKNFIGENIFYYILCISPLFYISSLTKFTIYYNYNCNFALLSNKFLDYFLVHYCIK